MTVKELSKFTGKDETTIRRWVKKASGKMPVTAGKMPVSSPNSPIDYTIDEVEAILRAGSMSDDAVSIIMNNARQSQQPKQINQSTEIDYERVSNIISKSVSDAVTNAVSSVMKEIGYPVKKLPQKRALKCLPDNPKPTASAIDFMDEWYISNDNYGMFLRKSVYKNYKTYSKHIGEDPKGLKNFYEAFRKNPNVTEKKSGEDYFVISEPNE